MVHASLAAVPTLVLPGGMFGLPPMPAPHGPLPPAQPTLLLCCLAEEEEEEDDDFALRRRQPARKAQKKRSAPADARRSGRSRALVNYNVEAMLREASLGGYTGPDHK